MKRCSWAMVALLAAYAALCGWVYATQDSAVFRPHGVEGGYMVVAPANALSLKVEGAVLAGGRFGGQGSPVVLTFAGNATDNIRFAQEVQSWTGRTTVGFNYRGYGQSTGRPTQEAIYADALVAFDMVASEGRPVVLVGYSMGASVAAWVAAHRPAAGVVLVAPFDSLAAVGGAKRPYLPVGLLLRHPFPTVDFVGKVTAPVVVIRTGEADTTIPPKHTDVLLGEVPNLTGVIFMPWSGHRVRVEEKFPPALKAALVALGL